MIDKELGLWSVQYASEIVKTRSTICRLVQIWSIIEPKTIVGFVVLSVRDLDSIKLWNFFFEYVSCSMSMLKSLAIRNCVLFMVFDNICPSIWKRISSRACGAMYMLIIFKRIHPNNISVATSSIDFFVYLSDLTMKIFFLINVRTPRTEKCY